MLQGNLLKRTHRVNGKKDVGFESGVIGEDSRK
jgi:hypothetical protein